MDITDRLFSGIKRVWGRNGAIGTAWEHLYEFSQDIDIRTVMGAGFAVAASSSSAADDTGGTGAITIRVYGLDVNYKEVSEDIVLDGQTPVIGTKVFLRVFGATVITHGTGKINAGDIYIIKTGTGGTYTTGVPGTITSALVKILAGEGSGMSGFYTVPANKRLRLESISFGNYTQACVLGIFSQNCEGTDQARALEFPLNMGNQASGVADVSKYGLSWPEKTDIIMRVKGAAASAVTTATMLLKEN